MSLPDGLRRVVAGILVCFIGSVLAFVTVIAGTSLVHSQVRNPVLDGVLWPVALIGAVLVVPSFFFFTIGIILEIVDSFAQPRLLGWSEYSLIGIGGEIGLVSAVLTTGLSRLTDLHLLTLGAGSSGSIFSLAAVTVPLGYVFYLLTQSDITRPARTKDRPDPDVVRQQRVAISDDSDGSTVMPNPHSPSNHTPQKSSPRVEDSSNSDNDTIDLDKREYHWTTETDVSFEDIGGMDDLKQELERDIIKPLTDGKDKAEELGIPLPNIVFYGPPGTGKTFLAKALATELGLPFAQLSGADLTSKWINESSEKVNSLFREAREIAEHKSGAVVFVDELDSVLKKRSGEGTSHEEDNKVVNEFLTHLQQTSDYNILFVGATNRLDSLDDAGMRSGRIDKEIYIGEPDIDARKEIIRAQLSDRPNQLTTDDINDIAARTEGLVASDLEALVVAAARTSAFERGDDTIRWADMNQALDDLS